MLSSRRLMPPIKFIDSPVDLGPCPQYIVYSILYILCPQYIGSWPVPTISNRGPGGPDQAPAHYPRNSPTRSRSCWARIQSPDYWGNPNLGGSGSRSVRGKANILLRVRSDMKIVIRGRGQEFQATLSLIKWVNCVYMDSDGRFFGLHLKAIKLAHI